VCSEGEKGREKLYSPGSNECNKERQNTFLISGFCLEHQICALSGILSSVESQKRADLIDKNFTIYRTRMLLGTMTMTWLISQILFLLIDKTNNLFIYKSLSFRGDRIQ
jgi:hypothetical protein